VVSLWEVQQFYGDFIVKFLSELSAWEVRAADEKRETLANPEITVALCAKLGVLQGLCFMYSLNAADQQCQRIITNCQSKGMHVSCGEMRDDLRELRRRFEDDFKTTYFLQLTAKQAEHFQEPMKDWDFMHRHFSKVRFNVEECMKCFALERYGAAVFHILQVAEYGVIKVADLLGVSGDKPGWGSLKRLSAILEKPYPQRSVLEQQHSKLLEDVVPLSVVMKDSWRHKLDHVDNQIIWVEKDFSAQAAEEIISATRAFMRKLAGDLP
jgi:hypothetical protein